MARRKPEQPAYRAVRTADGRALRVAIVTKRRGRARGHAHGRGCGCKGKGN
jgi:hypothetical protein